MSTKILASAALVGLAVTMFGCSGGSTDTALDQKARQERTETPTPMDPPSKETAGTVEGSGSAR